MSSIFSESYLNIIDVMASSQVSAIEDLILGIFLVVSRTQDAAAHYIQQQISDNPGCPLEETLRRIIEDLRTLVLKMNRGAYVAPDIEAALRERDGNRCCITGERENAKVTHIISPTITHDEELSPGGRLRPLLEVILSDEEIEQVFSTLGSHSKPDELKNLWLMEPSVHDTFRRGHFRIIKNRNIESKHSPATAESLGEHAWWIEFTDPLPRTVPALGNYPSFYRMPSTPDADKYPLPAGCLLMMHKKFSQILQVFFVKRLMENGWDPIKKAPWTLGRMGVFLLRNTLRFLPSFIRLRLYRFISAMAINWDPQNKGSDVKFLPLGLCLKLGREHTENEANALRLVEKHTTIHAPKLIDFVMIDDEVTPFRQGYILMTTVFGDRLSDVILRMTYEEQEQVGKDLYKWIEQLRRIPNKTNYLIANASGGPISDHRFESNTWGPFNSVADFTDEFTSRMHDQHLKHEPPINILYERKYDVYFTHSDLHWTNIIVQQGRLAGLVDWENAGFKPEYWEYIRVLWCTGGPHKKRRYVYDCAFGDKYQDEYKADVAVQMNSPFFWD